MGIDIIDSRVRLAKGNHAGLPLLFDRDGDSEFAKLNFCC